MIQRYSLKKRTNITVFTSLWHPFLWINFTSRATSRWRSDKSTYM